MVLSVTAFPCDLNAEYTQREQVSVVSFYVSFDGEHYLKEGKEAENSVSENGRQPRLFPKAIFAVDTDYMDAFRRFLQANVQCCVFVLTKTFSGSLQSAVSAKAEIGGVSASTEDLCHGFPAFTRTPGKSGKRSSTPSQMQGWNWMRQSGHWKM